MIFCGGTAIPRTIDFATFAEIAREVEAILVADIAHIAGLIVGRAHPHRSATPVMSTTTHKTLRGPRGAMLLCDEEHATALDRPSSRACSCPHNHTTAAIAVALHDAAQPAFGELCAARGRQCPRTRRGASRAPLRPRLGWDRQPPHPHRPHLQEHWRQARHPGPGPGRHLTNYNTVPFDPRKPFGPSGMCTLAVTSRGMGCDVMRSVAGWIDQAVEEALLELVRRDRDDASLGEEVGTHGHDRRYWAVDGIDGTSEFVTRSPLWSTLIALVEDDSPVLGLSTSTAQQRRWWPVVGHGAWSAQLESSGVGTAEPMTIADRPVGRRPRAWAEVMPPGHRTRPKVDRILARVDSVSMTTHSGFMVAAGELDLAVQVAGEAWDFAAIVPMVREAGGTMPGHPGIRGSRSAGAHDLCRSDGTGRGTGAARTVTAGSDAQRVAGEGECPWKLRGREYRRAGSGGEEEEGPRGVISQKKCAIAARMRSDEKKLRLRLNGQTCNIARDDR